MGLGQVEALDRFHNRCSKASAGEAGIPTPTISIEGSPELEYNPKEWDSGWSNTQAGGEVCTFRIVVGGPVGPLQLVVADQAGEGGASLLAGLDHSTLPPHLEHRRSCRCCNHAAWS